MNHKCCMLSIFIAICSTVIYSIFTLSYYVMICQPLTRILKFECCSCNQYAPDEDRDGRNVELINQQSYIGVGLLTITILLFIHVISRAHDRFCDPPSSKLVTDQHCLWDPLQVSIYIYIDR